jgi:putative alpha-1,2-mannosidase
MLPVSATTRLNYKQVPLTLQTLQSNWLGTNHVAMYQYTFPSDSKSASVVVDVSHVLESVVAMPRNGKEGVLVCRLIYSYTGVRGLGRDAS